MEIFLGCNKNKMPQTTTKASQLTFYIVAAMLVVLVALLSISIFKTNSLSSNIRDSCVVTGAATGTCKFTDPTKDEFSLNKFLNYFMLAITVIVLAIVVARNYLLG
jgi:hypothetical protein